MAEGRERRGGRGVTCAPRVVPRVSRPVVASSATASVALGLRSPAVAPARRLLPSPLAPALPSLRRGSRGSATTEVPAYVAMMAAAAAAAAAEAAARTRGDSGEPSRADSAASMPEAGLCEVGRGVSTSSSDSSSPISWSTSSWSMSASDASAESSTCCDLVRREYEGAREAGRFLGRGGGMVKGTSFPSFCCFSILRNHFWACDRIWMAVLVPTYSSIFFQLRPYRLMASTKRLCSSSVHFCVGRLVRPSGMGRREERGVGTGGEARGWGDCWGTLRLGCPPWEVPPEVAPAPLVVTSSAHGAFTIASGSGLSLDTGRMRGGTAAVTGHVLRRSTACEGALTVRDRSQGVIVLPCGECPRTGRKSRDAERA